jgi:hypothetical protein
MKGQRQPREVQEHLAKIGEACSTMDVNGRSPTATLARGWELDLALRGNNDEQSKTD